MSSQIGLYPQALINFESCILVSCRLEHVKRRKDPISPDDKPGGHASSLRAERRQLYGRGFARAASKVSCGSWIMDRYGLGKESSNEASGNCCILIKHVKRSSVLIGSSGTDKTCRT